MPPPLQSQTNQKGRRRMIKRDPTLIFLPGSHCWSEEDLWKVGMEWSCCLAIMDAATKTEKKKKKIQFSCSLWFLCGCTESHIQCRLGKFLFLLPTHPCPPFCSSSEVKQNVMYCILYDFFYFFIFTSEGNSVWK